MTSRRWNYRAFYSLVVSVLTDVHTDSVQHFLTRTAC